MKKVNEFELALDEELTRNIYQANTIDPTSEEYEKLMQNIRKICEIKNSKDTKNIDYIIRIFETAGPIAFYSVWMILGLRFERDGVLSSKVFGGLTKFFKPTKK